MQSKTKIAIAVLSVVGVSLATVGYLAYDNMLETEKNVNALISELNKELPKELVKTNEYHRGLFNSNGLYKIQLTHEKKQSGIEISYNLDHGLSALFSKTSGVEANLKVTGEVAKVLQDNGALLKVSGTLNDNGNADFKLNSNGFNIVSTKNKEEKIVFAKSTGTITYDKVADKLKTKYEFSNINVLSSQKVGGLNIKGFSVESDVKGFKKALGEVVFNIKTLSARNVTVSDINFKYGINLTKEKYNIKTGIKVGNIEIANSKDTKFEFQYSINDLSRKPIDYFIDTAEKFKKDTSADKEFKLSPADYEQVYSMIQSGLNISLDKMYLKSTMGVVDMNAKIEVLPVATKEAVSIEDNAKITFNLKATGPLVNFVKPYLTTETFDETTQTITINALYEKNELKVNGQPDIERGLMMRESLRNLDNKIGILRDLPSLYPEVEGVEGEIVEGEADLSEVPPTFVPMPTPGLPVEPATTQTPGQLQYKSIR